MYTLKIYLSEDKKVYQRIQMDEKVKLTHELAEEIAHDVSRISKPKFEIIKH